MKTIIIGVLRHDPEKMLPKQVGAVRACYPDDTVVFMRMDSVDYEDHDKLCHELGVTAVILPTERPIPTKAMARGIPHLTFNPLGGVAELEPLVPHFRPFGPFGPVHKDALFGLSKCRTCVHSAEEGDPCDHDIAEALRLGIIAVQGDIDWGR